MASRRISLRFLERANWKALLELNPIAFGSEREHLPIKSFLKFLRKLVFLLGFEY